MKITKTEALLLSKLFTQSGINNPLNLAAAPDFGPATALAARVDAYLLDEVVGNVEVEEEEEEEEPAYDEDEDEPEDEVEEEESDEDEDSDEDDEDLDNEELEVDGQVDADVLHKLAAVKTNKGDVEFEFDEDGLFLLEDSLRVHEVTVVHRTATSLTIYDENEMPFKYEVKGRYPKGWSAALPVNEMLEAVSDEEEEG